MPFRTRLSTVGDHRPVPCLPALVVGAAALLCGSPAEAACCPPELLARTTWSSTAGTVYDDAYSLTSDDLGAVHAVLQVNLRPGLFRSLDDGATWSAGDFSLIPLGAAWALATSPDGHVLLAWQESDMLMVRSSPDQGRTWSAAEALFQMFPIDPNPMNIQLVVRDSGLCAVRAIASGAVGVWRIRAAASPDFGATWNPTVTETMRDGSRVAELRHLAADERTVVLGFADDAGNILTRRSTDAGLSWEPALVANVTPNWFSSAFCLATTGDGFFQLSHASPGTPREVRVVVSSDEAASWSATDSVVGFTDDTGLRPVLVAQRDGRVAVGSWFDAVGAAGISSNLSLDRGLPGTWQPAPVTYSLEGVRPHHFRLTAEPGGSFLAVHDDYRDETVPPCPDDAFGACESIYVARACPGAVGWAAEQTRLDVDESLLPVHSEDPEISANGRGFLHVLWYAIGPSGPWIRHAALKLPSLPLEVSPGATDICRGEALTLLPQGGPHAWCRWSTEPPGQDGDGSETTGALEVSPDATTTYEVTCADAADEACTGSAVALVTVRPDPEVVGLDLRAAKSTMAPDRELLFAVTGLSPDHELLALACDGIAPPSPGEPCDTDPSWTAMDSGAEIRDRVLGRPPGRVTVTDGEGLEDPSWLVFYKVRALCGALAGPSCNFPGCTSPEACYRACP